MAARRSSRRASSTGQIYRDGDKWRVALEVGKDTRTGKPQYRTARKNSHAEAVDELNRMIKELGSGQLAPTSRLNLGTFLDQWLENVVKPTRAPKTHQTYAYVIESHVKPRLGSKPLDKITPRDIQALIAGKMKQKLAPRDKEGKNINEETLSPATLRNISAVLHTAFERAKNEGLISRNPAEHIERPRERRGTPQFLKPEQATAFLEAIDKSDIGDLFAFMLLTGTRIAEACGVRWEDLDFTDPKTAYVTIRGQLQRNDGKLEYRATTKTNQVRTIALNSFLVDRLKTNRAGLMVSGANSAPSAYVFLNADGRPIDQKFANNRLKVLCAAAGVPPISAHKLRHSAATLLLALGVELHTVAKILGHSQVRLTADLYGHVVPESVRSAMIKLDALTPRPH